MKNLIEKITVENTIDSIETLLTTIEDGMRCMDPMLKLDYTDENDLSYCVDSAHNSDETQLVIGRMEDLWDWLGIDIGEDDNGETIYDVPPSSNYHFLSEQLNNYVIEQLQQIEIDEAQEF
jgi:hypothetical protein